MAHLSSSKWEVRELTEVERSLDQQMRALGKTSLTVEASSQDETAFQLAPTDGGWAYILQGVPAFGVQFPPSIIRSVGQSKSAVLAERSGDIQDADLDVCLVALGPPFAVAVAFCFMLPLRCTHRHTFSTRVCSSGPARPWKLS